MLSQADTAWIERLLATKAKALGQAVPVGAGFGGVVDPQLSCPEAIPGTAGWPPPAAPWMNKLDGVEFPQQLPAATPPSRNTAPAIGVRLGAGGTQRKYVRPSRLSELEKLKNRIAALEDTLTTIREGVDQIKLAQKARPAAGAHTAMPGGALRMVADGTEHLDHGSEHRRKRTEMSLTFEDLDALRSADIDEIMRSL